MQRRATSCAAQLVRAEEGDPYTAVAYQIRNGLTDIGPLHGLDGVIQEIRHDVIRFVLRRCLRLCLLTLVLRRGSCTVQQDISDVSWQRLVIFVRIVVSFAHFWVGITIGGHWKSQIVTVFVWTQQCSISSRQGDDASWRLAHCDVTIARHNQTSLSLTSLFRVVGQQ